MSDGLEAIMKNTSKSRETPNSRDIAARSIQTSRIPLAPAAWRPILTDWGTGAIIPVMTIVLGSLREIWGGSQQRFCRLRYP